MFGLLLGAAGVGYADIGRDDHVRRARLAVRRESWRVEAGCEDGSGKNLADTRHVIRGWRG